MKKSIDEPSQQSLPIDGNSSICPLCEIPFDTAGTRRPVSDACGHTTCFQCFRAMMIKAAGCSLCQKEEEMNLQTTNYSVRRI